MDAIEIINYAKDVDYNFNVKCILLLGLTLYALFGIWYFNNKKCEYLYQWYLKKIVLALSKTWMAMGFLWVFLLMREVPIDTILRPIIVLYGVAGLLFVFSIFVFGGEKIKEFFTGEGFYREE